MFDYKKLIKSRALRMKMLHALDFVPDSLMVRLQYFIKTGRFLHLKNPKRYTEKIQWYKLYYKDPLMAQCVDKYEVRKYVEKCGLGYILNECYGVFDRAEDVDFDKLPNSFVLKDTLGGGGNDVIIVKDKENLDIPAVRKRMQNWVNYPYQTKHPGREWPYEGKKHRIIAEKLLEDPRKNDLPDYKFFCFNGNPVYCQVIMDRRTCESIDFFDMSWQLLPFNGIHPWKVRLPHACYPPKKPLHLLEMQPMCKKMAGIFPFTRVDFYEVENRIIFGELTFYPASGYGFFNPDQFDFILGEKFVLPTKRLQ